MFHCKIKKICTHGLLYLAKYPNSQLENDLCQLHSAIEQKKWDKAEKFAQSVSQKMHSHKSLSRKSIEFILTLCIAVAIAAFVRQVWFEPYEVPTGSMRPTIKEQDRVLVSKSAFGLNVPFQTKHFCLSQDSIQRGTLLIITADGLDIADTDELYFGLFPGKKRYVKRCAALPGDWVYFYGGNLYVLDKEEKKLFSLHETPELVERTYIPFISSFEGRVTVHSPTPFSQKKIFTLKHLNTPIGKIETKSTRSTATIPYGDRWSPEFSSHTGPRTIGDFWGIKNYALSKLLLSSQLPQKAKNLGYSDAKAVLWLELHHNPTLSNSPQQDSSLISLCTTWIPLYQEHIERLNQALYTARLVIKNNKLYRYYYTGTYSGGVPLPRPIPDGCYEFYYGKASKIGLTGVSSLLDPSHPIYPKNEKETAFWFNVGIDASLKTLSPTSHQLPTRFSYFNNETLFLLGSPIIMKGDTILSSFDKREVLRQTKDYSYFAFQDYGPPEKREFMKTYGFKVPDKHYLLLGDNPAMSVDSRYFGPVHEDNIEGTPLLLAWPYGPRWGIPKQPSSPISPYSMLFCFLTILGFSIFYTIRHRRIRSIKEKLHL